MNTEIKYKIKINNQKNNTFIAVSRLDGKLIIYKSLKRKKIKDLKVKLTWGLVSILKKLRNFKIKIKYILLYLKNLESNLTQHLFSIFKTWNIEITYLKYDIPVPHNGCRRSHLTRKRNKGLKKQSEIIMGL